MIRSITQQKPMEEIESLLNKINRVFIIGCGTCVTLTQTGGILQVEEMEKSLSEKGKVVTGNTVVPVACDNLTADILREFEAQLNQADGLLIMTCAFGVQSIARQINKIAIPALNTLFIGKETGAGEYNEVCTQCGICVIGETGGICPVTACHKGLVNGPCGGTNNGKCEIDSNKDCAWTLIYNRLKELERLDVMRVYKKPRNHLGEPSPGKFQIPV